MRVDIWGTSYQDPFLFQRLSRNLAEGRQGDLVGPQTHSDWCCQVELLREQGTPLPFLTPDHDRTVPWLKDVPLHNFCCLSCEFPESIVLPSTFVFSRNRSDCEDGLKVDKPPGVRGGRLEPHFPRSVFALGLSPAPPTLRGGWA